MSTFDNTFRVVAIGGGCDCHPVNDQLRQAEAWSKGQLLVDIYNGAEAFDHLDGADLVIAAGLHWTQSPTITWSRPFPYNSPSPHQRAAFAAYIASGRPVLSLHGGIASFDDWPEFGRLLGFGWRWGHTNHSQHDIWTVTPLGSHPLIAGSESFTIRDELYGHVQLVDDVVYTNHLTADLSGLTIPLLITGLRGPRPETGRCAWFGLGHDLESWSHPKLQPLFIRSLQWLLGEIQ